MNNGLSFNNGVLYRGEGVMLGEVKESALVSADDNTCEKCLSPGERYYGECIRQISMPPCDSLEMTFSQRGIKKAVLHSPYGGKYRHLFLYSKRKRIRKKNHWNAVFEMLSGGKT